MITALDFAILVLVTILAAAVAASFNWLLLRAAFHLMQPAAVRNPVMANLPGSGNNRLARALVLN